MFRFNRPIEVMDYKTTIEEFLFKLICVFLFLKKRGMELNFFARLFWNGSKWEFELNDLTKKYVVDLENIITTQESNMDLNFFMFPYIVIMDEETEVKKVRIVNWNFFQYVFNLLKTKDIHFRTLGDDLCAVIQVKNIRKKWLNDLLDYVFTSEVFRLPSEVNVYNDGDIENSKSYFYARFESVLSFQNLLGLIFSVGDINFLEISNSEDKSNLRIFIAPQSYQNVVYFLDNKPDN